MPFSEIRELTSYQIRYIVKKAVEDSNFRYSGQEYKALQEAFGV